MKPPLSRPNISLSIRAEGIAAQLTRSIGCDRRRLRSWTGRKHLLAGPGLAQEHRRIRGRDSLDQGVRLPQRRTVADDRFRAGLEGSGAGETASRRSSSTARFGVSISSAFHARFSPIVSGDVASPGYVSEIGSNSGAACDPFGVRAAFGENENGGDRYGSFNAWAARAPVWRYASRVSSAAARASPPRRRPRGSAMPCSRGCCGYVPSPRQ